MQQRQLGNQGLQVSALGLGCMGMSFAYGANDEQQALNTLARAFELGVDFLDTAEVYGPFTNETLLAKSLKGRKDIKVATKFGFRINDEGEGWERVTGVNSDPVHIRHAVEGSLQRLGVESIELLYQHRLDPAVPIEDVVGVMADLVREGKVKYLGLSEVSPATLRRACAVLPFLHCKVNTHCGRAIPSRRSLLPAVNLTSASCLTARWAAVSSPVSFPLRKRWQRMISAVICHASSRTPRRITRS